MTSRPLSSARSMTSGVTPWARMTTAAPCVDLVELLDADDALLAQLADDALVVDDLAERVRLLALGGADARGIDGLAHAIAEAGAAGDADFGDGSHGLASIASALRHGVEPGGYRRRPGLPLATVARLDQRGDAAHQLDVRRGQRRATIGTGRELRRNGSPDAQDDAGADALGTSARGR